MRRCGRPKKLNTEPEIDKVCFLYYCTDLSVREVSIHMGVGIPTVNRVLEEHGREYRRRYPATLTKGRKTENHA